MAGKQTRDGEVWIGGTTSGVIKCHNGQLLFKYRCNIDKKPRDFHKRLDKEKGWNKKIVQKKWEAWYQRVKKDALLELQGEQTNNREKSITFKQVTADVNFNKITEPEYKNNTGFQKVKHAIDSLNNENNSQVVRDFVNKPVQSVTQADCQELYDYFKINGKSYDTIARYKQAVSRVFKYLIRYEFVKINPSTNAQIGDRQERNRRKNKEIIAFDKDEYLNVMDFLVEMPAEKKRVLIELALTTGLRKGELLALTWSVVKLVSDGSSNDYLEVNKNLIEQSKEGQRRQVLDEFTKNGSTRVVPLTPPVAELLTEYKATEMEIAQAQKRFLPELLFHNDSGQPYNLNIPNRWWGQINDDLFACGKVRQKIKFHALRATAISQLVDAGNDIYTVQKIAGHRSITTTQRYYMKIDKKAMAGLGRSLKLPKRD